GRAAELLGRKSERHPMRRAAIGVPERASVALFGEGRDPDIRRHILADIVEIARNQVVELAYLRIVRPRPAERDRLAEEIDRVADLLAVIQIEDVGRVYRRTVQDRGRS